LSLFSANILSVVSICGIGSYEGSKSLSSNSEPDELCRTLLLIADFNFLDLSLDDLGPSAIVCRWVPLENVPRRVREVILRAIGLIVKGQSLPDVRSMLLTLFVVLSNETDGVKISTNLDTPCEKYKKNYFMRHLQGFKVNYNIF